MKPAPPVTRIGRPSPLMPPAPSLRARRAPRRPGPPPSCSRDPLGELGEALVEVLVGREAEQFCAPCCRRRSSGGCRRPAPCRRSRARRRCGPSRGRCACATSLTVRSCARADVEHLARRLRVHQRLAEGARHVADVDEVAPLLAILEDHRPLAVGEPRGEDRQHAGIGVGERLAGTVDVEQPQARRPMP